MQKKKYTLKMAVIYVTMILAGVNVLLTAAKALSGEQVSKAESFHTIAWENR